MVVNEIVQKMMEIGYSEYEGRAYLALLEENPATAYETAKRAAIPSSKIYQVIARLAEKGLVLPREAGARTTYVPLPPREFIESRRESIGKTIDGLEAELDGYKGNEEISIVWNLHTYDEFMLRAERLVRETTSSVLISLWGEERADLEQGLIDGMSRGLKLAVVLYGEESYAGRLAVFHHPIERTLHAERGGRGFTLVSDSREAMVGTILPDGSVEGAWSRNAGFVTLAEDYIKHDIYIMKIVNRYKDDLLRRFGDNYDLLRDVFSDRELAGRIKEKR